ASSLHLSMLGYHFLHDLEAIDATDFFHCRSNMFSHRSPLLSLAQRSLSHSQHSVVLLPMALLLLKPLLRADAMNVFQSLMRRCKIAGDRMRFLFQHVEFLLSMYPFCRKRSH